MDMNVIFLLTAMMMIVGVLKINPLTLLLPEVFASNVGSTATLI